jgi:hypothetical protein
MTGKRWDPCVEHRGVETSTFLKEFFADPKRKCCLVGGAGFDPRTLVCARILSGVLQERLRGVFLREERPGASARATAVADANLQRLRALIPRSEVDIVEILASDNAVVGGRNAVERIAARTFDDVTDIVVDMSALSIGTSFPIIRYLLELAQARQTPNLHVVVMSSPDEDEGRQRVSNGSPSIVHSFHGELRLHSSSQSAKLWMPQLSIPKKDALNVIFREERDGFDDVCPILPFPSRNPRAADGITEAFLQELEQTWSVDANNLVYASEDDPLDVYRTILEIEELRKPVFESIGSIVVLSPVGSKAVALGALMAALERSLPVIFVEALEYFVRANPTSAEPEGDLLHVWLYGEAYSSHSKEVLS